MINLYLRRSRYIVSYCDRQPGRETRLSDGHKEEKESRTPIPRPNKDILYCTVLPFQNVKFHSLRPVGLMVEIGEQCRDRTFNKLDHR